MVISILKDKYRCGSQLGYSATEEKEDLLKNLNSVIDWEFCTFPKTLKDGGDPKKDEDYIENREFLGSEPKLSPGNMFLYDGQVIAVDSEKRLVLCVTETGAWAIKRFQDDVLGNELKLRDTSDFNTTDVTCKEIDKINEGMQEYRVPYYLMKTWRERVLPGRFKEKDLNLQITMTSDDYFYPIVLVIQDWGVRYDPEFVPEDMIERTTLEALVWSFGEYKKLK